MEKKWIKTKQMLEMLKGEPDVEQQYCHYLGGILRSTHWLEYSSMKKKVGDSTNWFDYTWYTESEFLEIHAGEWWMREILLFLLSCDRILGREGGLSHLSHSVATSRRRFRTIIWKEPKLAVTLHRG